MEIVLAMIGEQFRSCVNIVGVVLASRPNYDIIQIWNNKSLDEEIVKKTTTKIRKILNLPSTHHIEYQTNKVFIKK